MLFSLHFTLLPILLLTSRVLASPILLVNPPTQAQNITITDPVALNSSLGFIPPTGPIGFTGRVVSLSTVSVEPKDVFITVIQMLETIAQNDFNSRMAQPVTIFRGPNNLLIIVSSTNRAEPVFRRLVMWGIARLIILMGSDDRIGYHVLGYNIEWQGSTFGKIVVDYSGRPSVQLSNDSTNATQDLPTIYEAEHATTTVGDDQIAWIYEPGGRLQAPWDIAMSTIGGLIEAAGFGNRDFNDFIGDFPPIADSICKWQAINRPSRFSKSILIRSMASAAVWALNDGDFHELSIKVLLDGYLTAVGQYISNFPVLSSWYNSTAVSK